MSNRVWTAVEGHPFALGSKQRWQKPDPVVGNRDSERLTWLGLVPQTELQPRFSKAPSNSIAINSEFPKKRSAFKLSCTEFELTHLLPVTLGFVLTNGHDLEFAHMII